MSDRSLPTEHLGDGSQDVLWVSWLSHNGVNHDPAVFRSQIRLSRR